MTAAMMSDHQDPDSDMSANEEFDVSVYDLIRAAQYGRLDEVEALVVQYGVDINGLDSESNWTPLQIASFNGRTDVVRFLIENGAEIDKRWTSLGFQQWSAIHFASTRGHRDVVELLLSSGATVNDVEHEGKKPIHLACENGHEELVLFLLSSGSTVHDRDQNGFTPLMWACLYGHHQLVVTLIANGARVNERALSNARPITFACGGGHNGLVMTLIAQGAEVNDYDFPVVSPLYAASRNGHHEVVRTLLAHGAQVRGRDFSRWSPLHPACTGGHYEVVQTLLDQGAKVETYDDKGLTPLHNVCNGMCRSRFVPHLQMSNKAYTLKILLEYGLDPKVTDMDGLTTFERVRKDEWALYSFDKDVLSLLLDYGVGPGVVCRVEKCDCKTTALMCWYLFFRLLFTVSPEARETAEPLIDTFEKYFIKSRVLGFNSCKEEKAFEPPVEALDWNYIKREAYHSKCEEELSRIKVDTIGNTSATYFSLLTRDLPTLCHQNMLGLVNSDDCVQRYPIYGSMVFASYVRLHRVFLEEESPRFFAIFSPPLLPECAEVVQSYLSIRDLENLVQVYRTYQIYIDKIPQPFTAE